MHTSYITEDNKFAEQILYANLVADSLFDRKLRCIMPEFVEAV